MNLAYQECPRCDGDGYQHLFGSIYRYPCKACGGSGERPRVITRVWRMVRHGAAIRED